MTSSSSTPQVLVYDENTVHQHTLQALTNLGVSFQRAGASDFVSLLHSRRWACVVMDLPSTTPAGSWQAGVIGYVGGGGRFVLNFWDLSSEPGLQAAFEVATHGDENNATAQVFPWLATDPLWTSPNNLSGGVTGDGHSHWGTKGQHMSVLAGAVALGGFTVSPAPNDAGMVRGNSGRTLVVGYLVDLLANDDSGNGKADGIDLMENAITEVCSGATPAAVTAPTLEPKGLLLTTLLLLAAGALQVRRLRRS